MPDNSPASVGDNDASKSVISSKAIISIIIAIAALTFVFSNVAPATLRFLVFQFTMPAWGWFLAILLSGVVIGSLFPWFRPRKK